MALAFVRGIHRWPVNSLHKEPVTRKTFPFDDIIMQFPDFNGHLAEAPFNLGHEWVVTSHWISYVVTYPIFMRQNISLKESPSVFLIHTINSSKNTTKTLHHMATMMSNNDPAIIAIGMLVKDELARTAYNTMSNWLNYVPL